MKQFLGLVTAILLVSCGPTRFNKGAVESIPFTLEENRTSTFQETRSFYQSLDKASSFVQTSDYGMTDAGHPLQEVIIDMDRDFDVEKSRKKGKLVLFINNGIHAGEPCGVDASMLFATEILRDKSYAPLLENVVIVIVPLYNVGGAINRNSFTRANQNGPDSHGFRGNAKNLDLNRDFIKCDSKNAQSLNQLFTKWMPDVFIDTHTSNGSDYQHIITLIATQKDKLAPAQGLYLDLEFLPKVYSLMKEDGYDMSPYVYSIGSTPDEKGIAAFPDLARYSSGYAALHHSLSFMPETHMLKTFEERVKSTEALLVRMLEVSSLNAERIMSVKKEAMDYYEKLDEVPLQWSLVEKPSKQIPFKGYESERIPSKVTKGERLYYNRDKPFSKDIDLYNDFEISKKVSAPKTYIIPQAYSEVIDRLMWNGVQMDRLEEDMEYDVEMYYVDSYDTRKTAYEGHYLHSNTTLRTVYKRHKFHKGDYVVEVGQAQKRFIMETLEPSAPDSYFNWNFFDGILMQKEHFSPYVFEDIAEELLKKDPALKREFEAKKEQDAEFAKSVYAQLDFIYKRSPHYEYTHNLYPLGRLMK